MRVLTILALAMLTGTSVAAEPSELQVYSGEGLYQRFCASCHGAAGEGNGPVAAYLKLRTPDLTGISARSGGVFPADRVRRIIDGRENLRVHGEREMPVWGWEFYIEEGGFRKGEDARAARERTDETITKLVEYLRSLQKPKKQPQPEGKQ
jgi:mono/diheme cytochrome c family protein